MSTNSALADLHVPAHPISNERGNEIIAVIRRLVGRPRLVARPRWSQERPGLKTGDSYRISDGRRRYDGAFTWVHSHH
jgi:hypothetical protein